MSLKGQRSLPSNTFLPVLTLLQQIDKLPAAEAAPHAEIRIYTSIISALPNGQPKKDA
jgi:hypothetical protein